MDLDLSVSYRSLFNPRFIPLPLPTVQSRLAIPMGSKQRIRCYFDSALATWIAQETAYHRGLTGWERDLIALLSQDPRWYASLSFEPVGDGDHWRESFVRY